MSSCPDCENIKIDSHSSLSLNSIMHNEKAKICFFKNAISYKCSLCYKDFIQTRVFYSYKGSNIFDFSTDKGSYCANFFIMIEKFNDLKTTFDINQLIDYLPNDNLKRTYKDALTIINNNPNLSNEIKMGSIRPVLEAFINYENNVEEDKKVRVALYTLAENNHNNLPEDYYSRLHVILDETLKGVHIKKEKLSHDPDYVLQVLETLFTKIYMLPKEKKKLEEYIKEETARIDKLLNNQIQFINKK